MQVKPLQPARTGGGRIARHRRQIPEGWLDLRHRVGRANREPWRLLPPDRSHDHLSSTGTVGRTHACVDAVARATLGCAVNRLDLRGLPMPDPMQGALSAADALEPGQALQVLMALPPMPLLQALEARGLRWRIEPLTDGGAWIAILRPAA